MKAKDQNKETGRPTRANQSQALLNKAETGPFRLRHICLGVMAAAAAWLSSTVTVAAIGLEPVGTYATGVYEQGAAEIVVHDPINQRLFVVNAQAPQIEVLDLSDPSSPTPVAAIPMLPYGGIANSVAVHGGLVAVAMESTVKTDPGQVVFFNSSTLDFLKAVPVGALPDMLTFSPDGRWVLTANEGEPSSDYSIDPEGSVSIIDLATGVANATVRTAGFAAFNNLELPDSIRIFGPNATVAMDLEPEFIAVSDDSTTAWVTLQENNALAILDIEAGTVTRLVGLGFKNHRAFGNGLDASDRDGGINIKRWPLKGMYLPDGIAAYTHRGQTHLVLANEGDSRDYDAFSEESRVGTLKLDSAAFPDAAQLKDNARLGRLKVSNVMGDPDGDGDYDELYAFGARSFSIRNAVGALMFDSGDQFEQITAAVYPEHFNADNTDNELDGRSDDKGPEPECVALGQAYGRTLAFIGLERIGGILVYDISNPRAPVFESDVNNRDFADPFDFGTAKDLGPEGLAFIGADVSPSGQPLLVVANEISGTTTIYKITP